MIHDFLTPFEIAKIKEQVFPRLTYNESQSLTVYSNSDTASFPDSYKAATIFLEKIENDRLPNKKDVMDGISKRIQQASYLIIKKEDRKGEFRASVYGLGGMTEQHSDSYEVESGKEMTDMYKEYFKTGDVIATMMLYISDVPLGGGTYFSSKNYEDVVFPEKGSALLWFNLKSSGFTDWRQGHGGCPVAEGHKFAVTKWFHHYYQWKKFQCAGDKDKLIDMNKIIRSSTQKKLGNKDLI